MIFRGKEKRTSKLGVATVATPILRTVPLCALGSLRVEESHSTHN